MQKGKKIGKKFNKRKDIDNYEHQGEEFNV